MEREEVEERGGLKRGGEGRGRGLEGGGRRGESRNQEVGREQLLRPSVQEREGDGVGLLLGCLDLEYGSGDG